MFHKLRNGFRQYASRLGAALHGFATSLEVEDIIGGLDSAVTEHYKQSSVVAADDIRPRANRAQRRYWVRMRDRNSVLARRNRALTPRALHEDAHNKGLQFIHNPLLTGLLFKSGAMDASTELHARYPAAKLVLDGGSKYEVIA